MSIIDKLNVRLNFGKHVNIDYQILDAVCNLLFEKIDPEICKPFDWRNDKYWPSDAEDPSKVSQFFAIGNAINFRYWFINEKGEYTYCQGKKGGSLEKGAKYMWRSLKVCYDNDIFPILKAEKIAKITLNEMKRIFQTDEGSDVMPALQERLLNWRDLGHKLFEYWNGKFYNLVQKTEGSLFNFIQFSRQFRAFDDPLCKMTMVNAIMHQGREIIKFDMPIFPAIDYQLMKQQIRIGILILKEEISKKIKCRKLLESSEARELRNASLTAFLRMMEKTSLPGDLIDNIWWENRKICQTEKPLCERCLFYNVCLKRTDYGIPLEDTRYY